MPLIFHSTSLAVARGCPSHFSYWPVEFWSHACRHASNSFFDLVMHFLRFNGWKSSCNDWFICLCGSLSQPLHPGHLRNEIWFHSSIQNVIGWNMHEIFFQLFFTFLLSYLGCHKESWRSCIKGTGGGYFCCSNCGQKRCQYSGTWQILRLLLGNYES